MDIYIYFNYRDKDSIDAISQTTEKYSVLTDDSIPENIISAYNTVFRGALTNRIYPDVIWWFFIAGPHRQNYVQLDLAYDISHKGTVKIISIANQLDNKLTPRQRIYAYLMRVDFANDARGIQKAAKLYYGKTLNELNERQCLELMLMTKNTALYNKWRHQDLLDKEVDKLLGLTRGNCISGLLSVIVRGRDKLSGLTASLFCRSLKIIYLRYKLLSG